MASLIPGYEYDIFISYRQKDNKHDNWVTEFVDNLKGELEATFKEEISVYFDINPHDGLLETHDVDASLKDKLKCLIFIPIISRTYCDPKSFAWEHEFKAFVEQTSQDQFGLKVKLSTGNVASRVLPVRIHDLDNDDIKLCESVLGGFLRGIEFIYKEPGVNKPLTLEDNEKKNLNNTKYGVQINKVANAIKEIISGLKKESVLIVKGKTQQNKRSDEIIEVEIIDKQEILRSADERISVVVLPFQNMTNDISWDIWQDGIQDILINSLSNSEELRVRQTGSIKNLIQSKGLNIYTLMTPSLASIISKKLDADVFIFGSIKQVGITIRLSAQLIDSKSEEVFKSFQIDGSGEMILTIIDSLSANVKDFLEVSKMKKNVTQTFHYAFTNSPDAYRYFFMGQSAFTKWDLSTARNMLSKALEIDSNFYFAASMLSFVFGHSAMYKQAKEQSLKLYEKRDLMPMQQKIMAYYTYATFHETPHEAIKYLRRLQEIDDQSTLVHHDLGFKYNELYQFDKAIIEFEKFLEIYNKWGTKPEWVIVYTQLGYAYHKTGQYKKEKKLYKKADQDFPNNPDLIYRQVILSFSEGDIVTATQYFEEYISIRKDQSWSDAQIANTLANIYSEAGFLDKAEEYFRQSLSLEAASPERFNILAYFLIDKDSRINEGLELVDKVLKLKPDDYSYLHTKGWGLYKQGKYHEALEVLQKSWDLRMKNALYDHSAYLHLQAAKKAVAGQ